MAIQMRRGAIKDFDKNKMLPGEFAVTTDGTRKVYAAFSAGDVKELAAKEDVQNIVDDFDERTQNMILEFNTNAENKIQEATSEINAVKEDAINKGNKEVQRLIETANAEMQKVINKGNEVLESIPDDYEKASQNADNAIRYKAGAIVQKASGETIVVNDSSGDYARDFKLFGKTEQDATKGYQLFDASKLPTTSAGGATVTNNGDGSFTISGSGNLTNHFFVTYEFTHEETIKLLKTGNIMFKVEQVTNPYSYVQLRTSGGNFNLGANSGYTETINEITQEMLDDETSRFEIGFWGSEGHTIKAGTIKPMSYQSGDGTLEQFTGGKPSPSPEYKQPLNSVGKMVNLASPLIKGVSISPQTGEESAKDTAASTDYISVDLVNKDYYLSGLSSALYSFVAFYNSEKMYLGRMQASAYSNMQITASEIPLADIAYIRITTYESDSVTGKIELVDNMKLMLNGGTTALPYRPYTGQMEVGSDFLGKNLIGFETYSSEVKTSKIPIKISKGKYKFTMFNPDGSTTGLIKGQAYISSFQDAGGVDIVPYVNDGKEINEEQANRITQIRIVYDGSKYTGSHSTVCGQLEFGLKETEYEPYNRQSHISLVGEGLNGIPLGSTIPDVIKNSPIHMDGVYWDEKTQQYYISDTVDNESDWAVRRVANLHLDGSDKYILQYITSYGNALRFDVKIDNSQKSLASLNVGLCSGLPKGNVSQSNVEVFAIHGVEKYPMFQILAERLETPDVSGLKKYLAENPMDIQYVLAEPYTEPLTASEIESYKALHSNYHVTTVMNDCDAYMEFGYNADTKCYIDNLEKKHDEEMNTLKTAIIALGGTL